MTATQPSSEQGHPVFVVVDDHDMILRGTLSTIQQGYPDAQIITAQYLRQAIVLIKGCEPDLIVMDLSIPEQEGAPSQIENGLTLLRGLLERYPEMNIMVQSAHVRSLIRLKPAIDLHQGGFIVADKGASLELTQKKISWGLQGIFCTPQEMRNGLEIKSAWLEVLRLAFVEGLQDKAIAQRMHLSERTIRYYWTKVQDALDVYPDEGHNVRIQTQIRAREEGLLD